MNQSQQQVLEEFIGNGGITIDVIIDCTRLSNEIKKTYLQKAITETSENFSTSLDTLYDPNIDDLASFEDHIEFIKALKIINDIYFNSEFKDQGSNYGINRRLNQLIGVLGAEDLSSDDADLEQFQQFIKQTIIGHINNLPSDDQLAVTRQSSNTGWRILLTDLTHSQLLLKPDTAVDLINSYLETAMIYLKHKDYQKTSELLFKIKTTIDVASPKNDNIKYQMLSEYFFHRGLLNSSSGNYQQASNYFAQCQKIIEKISIPHTEKNNNRFAYAIFYRIQHSLYLSNFLLEKNDQAFFEKFLEKEKIKNNIPVYNQDIVKLAAETANKVGLFYLNAKKSQDANKFFNLAIEIQETLTIPTEESTLNNKKNNSILLKYLVDSINSSSEANQIERIAIISEKCQSTLSETTQAQLIDSDIDNILLINFYLALRYIKQQKTQQAAPHVAQIDNLLNQTIHPTIPAVEAFDDIKKSLFKYFSCIIDNLLQQDNFDIERVKHLLLHMGNLVQVQNQQHMPMLLPHEKLITTLLKTINSDPNAVCTKEAFYIQWSVRQIQAIYKANQTISPGETPATLPNLINEMIKFSIQYSRNSKQDVILFSSIESLLKLAGNTAETRKSWESISIHYKNLSKKNYGEKCYPTTIYWHNKSRIYLLHSAETTEDNIGLNVNKDRRYELQQHNKFSIEILKNYLNQIRENFINYRGNLIADINQFLPFLQKVATEYPNSTKIIEQWYQDIVNQLLFFIERFVLPSSILAADKILQKLLSILPETFHSDAATKLITGFCRVSSSLAKKLEQSNSFTQAQNWHSKVLEISLKHNPTVQPYAGASLVYRVNHINCLLSHANSLVDSVSSNNIDQANNVLVSKLDQAKQLLRKAQQALEEIIKNNPQGQAYIAEQSKLFRDIFDKIKKIVNHNSSNANSKRKAPEVLIEPANNQPPAKKQRSQTANSHSQPPTTSSSPFFHQNGVPSSQSQQTDNNPVGISPRRT